MEIINLRSDTPHTHFAATWHETLRRFHWEGDYDALRDWMRSKESELLELPVSHDAGTGLSDESVTTRFGRYNVFDYIDECPELANLLHFLRISYISTCQSEQVPILEIDISCWFNILRDGEGMKEHVHSCTSFAYLSGNLQLSEFNTTTKYRAPIDYFGGMYIENSQGSLILFPSYIPHSIDHGYEGERFSLAFDLAGTGINHNFSDPDQPERESWVAKRVTFMNSDIYNTMQKEAEEKKKAQEQKMPERVPGIWTGGSITLTPPEGQNTVVNS